MEGQFGPAPGCVLPPLLIDLAQLTTAVGLLLRSRLAWSMAVLLVIAAVASLVFGLHYSTSYADLFFAVAVGVAGDPGSASTARASLRSTLFAFTSVAMLIMYATMGSYYLGRRNSRRRSRIWSRRCITP